MQVKPSGSSESISSLDLQAAARRTAQPAGDSWSSTSLDSIKVALDKTAEVRDAEVTRAKGLVDNPKYPPAETLRRITNLLALHIADTQQ
jgi:hypothetical protein